MPKTRLLIFVVLLIEVTLVAAVPFNVSSPDLPDEAYICCIYGSRQSYTLSCEARAAVDWAAFFGYSITEYAFMAALPTSDNPEKGFVGYWNGIWGNIPPNSYGVHPPPVAQALRDFGVPAKAHSGLTFDDLRREIAAGRPVIVWVVAQMWPGTPVEYEAEDGSKAVVAYYEHAMILTGYNPNSVQVTDPGSGMTEYFYLNAFLNSWAVLGNRAILAGETEPTPTPSPTPTPTPMPTPTPVSEVVIQPGDTLIGVAQTYQVSWETLVSHNNLVYPYFIYPGDLLHLP